jgi:hypothetical protein
MAPAFPFSGFQEKEPQAGRAATVLFTIDRELFRLRAKTPADAPLL